MILKIETYKCQAYLGRSLSRVVPKVGTNRVVLAMQRYEPGYRFVTHNIPIRNAIEWHYIGVIGTHHFFQMSLFSFQTL